MYTTETDKEMRQILARAENEGFARDHIIWTDAKTDSRNTRKRQDQADIRGRRRHGYRDADALFLDLMHEFEMGDLL